jgi:hypothetical protein
MHQSDGKGRKALRQLTQFGTYRAPALLVTLTSKKALAQTDHIA